MRFVLFAICFLMIAFVIKIDLQEGAINYTKIKKETISCEESFIVTKVRVKVQHGDTLQSMFAAIPSEQEFPLYERVVQFYEMNPHLKKQAPQTGESVYIPIIQKTKKGC